ncbi:MAG: cyclic pyranopterin monophosphate synthase accessory protein 3 [Candidatus Binatia bacterium]|nr:MAG: cyclic pyranopterin monophosphate synthase accessory protein 3 [Candidatus Binatia bacterium]
MVDVGGKPVTLREAQARAVVQMKPETLERIVSGRIEKGEVFSVARLAGIMAAKRTGDLIPLCHPLGLDVVEVHLDPIGPGEIEVRSRVKVEAKTGVEMEALVAVTIAALTVYDMCKAVDRDIEITSVHLLEKKGGRSGTYRRKPTKPDSR